LIGNALKANEHQSLQALVLMRTRRPKKSSGFQLSSISRSQDDQQILSFWVPEVLVFSGEYFFDGNTESKL
jgi:hypothetical protein